MPVTGSIQIAGSLALKLRLWPLVAAIVFCIAVTFALDIATAAGTAVPFLYALVVFLALLLPRQAHAIGIAALCSVLVVVGAWLTPPGSSAGVAIFNRTLTMIVLWALILFDSARRAAQSALREREEELSAFLENAPIGIHLIDAQGRVMWANRHGLEQLGYAQDEYVGKHLSELHADKEVVDGILAVPGSADDHSYVETRLRRKDGTLLHAAISSNVYRHQGKFVHTRCFIHDISERKRAEEVLSRDREELDRLVRERTQQLMHTNEQLRAEIALRQQAESGLKESETRLRALMDHSPALIFIKDTEGRYLHVNRQFEKQFGVNRDQIIGRTDTELFSPGQAEAFRANDRRVMHAGLPLEFEEIAQYQDGPHTNIVSKFPLYDESGNCYAICGIATDISERMRMQEQLQEAEQHFRSLVGSVQAIIWRRDPLTFQFSYVSSQAETLLGYPAERWVLEPNFWISHIHPEDRERAVSFCARFVSEHKDHELDYRMLTADGRTVWLRDIVRIEFRDGRPTRLSGIMLDITSRKEVENSAREYAAQLESLSLRLLEVQESERRHLSRELHDQVGQNLTALSINLNLLDSGLPRDSGSLKERIADSIALVEATAERIENVLAELRPPMLDDYGLVAALRWYATIYSRRTGIPVQVLAPANLDRPSPVAEAALFRIAQEALTNTAKHAGARSASIRISRDNKSLRLGVHDDGVGFDPAILQGPSKAARQGVLSMRERALAVGGKLNIHSSPGQGTRIDIEIAIGT